MNVLFYYIDKLLLSFSLRRLFNGILSLTSIVILPVQRLKKHVFIILKILLEDYNHNHTVLSLISFTTWLLGRFASLSCSILVFIMLLYLRTFSIKHFKHNPDCYEKLQ